MVIVLNGTAASGKGTLSRLLALHLKLPHYDFGLIFRAIAHFQNSGGWDAVDELIARRSLFLDDGRLYFGQSDLTRSLMTEEAGLAAAVLASKFELRMVQTAKRFVKHVDFVADGRTISAIFPDADRHFQITSDYDTAQQRRLEQGGDAIVFHQRWVLDESRMAQYSGAILINTSGQTPEQTLRLILAYV
jgi:cytidylate kinase